MTSKHDLHFDKRIRNSKTVSKHSLVINTNCISIKENPRMEWRKYPALLKDTIQWKQHNQRH